MDRNKCPQRSKGALSLVLYGMIAVLSLFAVTLACVTAVRDGYTHWSQRLLYFTQMSNVWIGTISLVYVLYTVRERRSGIPIPSALHVLRYIGTVSITLTGIIFCGLLAPFADSNIWTFSSVLTHTVVPILSIVAFFLDRRICVLRRCHVWLCTLPPLGYFIFCSVLFFLNVDFGKGEPYPYFFMNLRSEVGWLGARWGGDRPELGTLWWLLAILALILGLAAVYRAQHPSMRAARREARGEAHDTHTTPMH